MCRDCPVPNCGARYLVKLSNHLTDVHELDYYQRRKWLQKAKLQPKVKIMIYDTAKVQERSVGLAQILNMRIRTKRSFVKITLIEEVFYKKTKRKGHLSKKRKL